MSASLYAPIPVAGSLVMFDAKTVPLPPGSVNFIPPARALPSIFCIRSFTESWQPLQDAVRRSHLPRASLSEGDGGGGGGVSSGWGTARMNIEIGKLTEVLPASFFTGVSVRR